MLTFEILSWSAKKTIHYGKVERTTMSNEKDSGVNVVNLLKAPESQMYSRKEGYVVSRDFKVRLLFSIA